MNSNLSRSNTCRFEGCTITGALAVSAFVTDAVSIVHGPSGCAHHNLSLLHATTQHQYARHPLSLHSSCLKENDIIFGGEEALEKSIEKALDKNPGAIFVISTCIVETIGDDVEAVCAKEWDVPVIYLKSAGFLGGAFNEGFMNALLAMTHLIEPPTYREYSVNLIGEKNLEFEVEEHYQEIFRLLRRFDIPVNVRFVRNASTREIARTGNATLNILREENLAPLGQYLSHHYNIPYIPKFPVGLKATNTFLEDLGRRWGVSARDAVREEEAYQEEIIAEFEDLRGESITFDSFGFQNAELDMLREVAEAVGMTIRPEGTVIPIPMGMPVGSSGIARMLREWRRFIHA
jgi:nitrogenase molybdenum-iron protein alpha/beta subunit